MHKISPHFSSNPSGTSTATGGSGSNGIVNSDNNTTDPGSNTRNGLGPYIKNNIQL